MITVRPTAYFLLDGYGHDWFVGNMNRLIREGWHLQGETRVWLEHGEGMYGETIEAYYHQTVVRYDEDGPRFLEEEIKRIKEDLDKVIEIPPSSDSILSLLAAQDE